MLPNDGVHPTVDKPTEARPVVLLSVVYRVWGCVRAPQLELWLQRQGVKPLPHPRRGAEEYALHTAALLEEAVITGEEAAALCLDLSKAYDRIALECLKAQAEAAGVSMRIIGPAFDAYAGSRIIKINDGCGEERVPTHGLPPGCPLATK